MPTTIGITQSSELPVTVGGDRHAPDGGPSGAHLILVSREIAPYLKAKLSHDVCTVDRLEGCRAAFDRVFEVATDLAILPGTDDTLADVTNATWGL